MPVLQDKDKKAIVKEFSSLSGPVTLVNFTREIECRFCRDTTSLVKELSDLSDKLTTEVYNVSTDKEAAAKYKVDRVPATIFVNGEDRGLRFYGVPSGYEFVTVLETVKMISQNNSGLSKETKEFLGNLKKPVHLQVFVTPACPYCPRAVLAAFKMAYESPLVTADAIEATEFPELAMKYGVQGVPRTVINDTLDVEGAVPEQMLLDAIKEAIA
ncbi:MAG TPA: glutaredoxin [candidate division Zixibacteria bacterium]|nr:glutaredoxin [candidate division Zixibacteria bacterium]